MQNFIPLAQIDETAQAIKSRISIQPIAGIILGSGLNHLADSVQNAVYIPFGELPHFPVSTVQGHSGRFVIGELEGKPVLIMQGRIHCYEGYSMSQTTLPVRVMQRLGIPTLMLTNAAGGIHPDFAAGDAMLITDQINLVGMVGLNPLIGPNLDEIGVRFPDMSQIYDRAYCDLARKVAKENGIKLQEGVYVGLSGPAFETPAELRFLRMIGHVHRSGGARGATREYARSWNFRRQQQSQHGRSRRARNP
jgi:purine-nucleoside phosphorylase